jgi:septal ring factor EnvC (AmiA/AmiB activator)
MTAKSSAEVISDLMREKAALQLVIHTLTAQRDALQTKCGDLNIANLRLAAEVARKDEALAEMAKGGMEYIRQHAELCDENRGLRDKINALQEAGILAAGRARREAIKRY